MLRMSEVWCHVVLVGCLALGVGGCGSKAVVVPDLDQFAEQGPGVESPEALVKAFTSAVNSRDFAGLQAMVFHKDLTKKEQTALNTQFFELVNTKLMEATFIEPLAVFKNDSLAEWAWYLYRPEVHEKFVLATREYRERLANLDPSEKPESVKPPAEMLDEPTQPEVPGTPNVRPLGLLRAVVQSTGKPAFLSEIVFLVGKADKGESVYLGTVVYPKETAPATAGAPAER
ncbi:MAG: hypothetical protein JNM18_05590 [Planctomycetaceae bacterium]|nr:hypothetical protein [Planctomycetaceae bacterium]